MKKLSRGKITVTKFVLNRWAKVAAATGNETFLKASKMKSGDKMSMKKFLELVEMYHAWETCGQLPE